MGAPQITVVALWNSLPDCSSKPRFATPWKTLLATAVVFRGRLIELILRGVIRRIDSSVRPANFRSWPSPCENYFVILNQQKNAHES